jgi:mannose/cellobiose epimerase-like protein (N-acyl-D-glucosamine 2-epimerase family)
MVRRLCNLFIWSYMKYVHFDDNASGSYIPNRKLIEFMRLRLQREKNKRDPETTAKAFSDKDKRKIRNLDRMKVYTLNKHIFQAMANLTFFFESIAESPELQEVFEDDIKELLFWRKKKIDKVQSENKKPLTIDQTQAVFTRLLDAMLIWNERKDPNNFRLALIYILQNIIFQKINNLALTEFGDTIANNIVQADMGRAWAWTKLYARRVEKDDEESNRPVLF